MITEPTNLIPLPFRSRETASDRGDDARRSPSDAVSRDLKGRGMRFVGSVIIYSYLQAAGIIDDHEPECDFCCGRQRAKEQPLGIE